MYKNSSLKFKIFSNIGIVCIFLLVIGGVNLYLIQNSAKLFKVTKQDNLISDMRFWGSEVSRLFLRTTSKGLTEAEVSRLVKKFEDHIALYEKTAEKYAAGTADAEESKLYSDVQEKWKSFLEKARASLKLVGSTKEEEVKKLLEDVDTIVPKAKVQHNDAFEKVVTYRESQYGKWKANIEWQTDLGTLISLGSVILGLFASIASGFFLSRGLTVSLSSIANSLSAGAQQLGGAAHTIASTSVELSASTVKQASSVQESVASLQEIGAMLEKTAENASLSSKTADENRSKAEEGQKVVQDLVLTIGEISQANEAVALQVNESNKELGEIVKVISEIGSKTKVINDIVFQTKLLSFNASVEAARAGEHGKGFAVVAEEVGNLAKMSGGASQEITQLLDSSIHKVQEIVEKTKSRVGNLIEDGKVKAQAGSKVAQECGEVMAEFLANSLSVSNMLNEISVATREQTQGISAINQAMSSLDDVTNKNSSASQMTASAAEELSAQVGSLRDTVNVLTTTVYGQTKTSAPAPVSTENVVKFSKSKKAA